MTHLDPDPRDVDEAYASSWEDARRRWRQQAAEEELARRTAAAIVVIATAVALLALATGIVIGLRWPR